MRRLILWAAAAAVALAGLRAGPLDLLAGAAVLVAGLVAWERRPDLAAGPLLGAAGVAWFAGDVWDAALFWHRALLIHAVLSFPGWWPRRRGAAGVIVAGYACALILPVSRSATLTIALGAVVLLAARRSPAGAVLGAGLVGIGTARLAGAADELLLAVYDVAVGATAVLFAAAAASRPWERVTDLVVELTAEPSGSVRDALARALGDATLAVGFPSPDGFRGAEGGLLGAPGPGRELTRVERDGAVVAALVHRAGVFDDARLLEAIAAAAQLAADNARLHAEVRAQIEEIEASRARLLAVANEERARLQQRLREGPEVRLERIASLLSPQDAEAAAVLRDVRADLRALAHGLAPGRLDEALAPLAEASAVPVTVHVEADGLAPETSAIAYFVCAEALANASKHARANSVKIDVGAAGDMLGVAIADDGVGGADPHAGTGLRGLAERVAACGGQLTIDSPSGGGTRVVAAIPLNGSAATASR